MRYLLFTLLCLLHSAILISQENLSDLSNKEQSLKLRFDSVRKPGSDSVRLVWMDQFRDSLARLLESPASFNYPFDSLKNIGRIESPDQFFRLFSWNMLIGTDSFKNYCIIQFKPQKNSSCRIAVLHDNSEIDQAGNLALTSKNWYGALYYRIIPFTSGGKTYYTVLGLDTYSPYISKKVIDILYINNDEVFLGAPLFNAKGKTFSRVVFSFSARISMMLNYDERLKTIVFDHLSPSDPRYAGQFEYYGPDFSYDGFLLTKDHWEFVEDVKPNRPVRK